MKRQSIRFVATIVALTLIVRPTAMARLRPSPSPSGAAVALAQQAIPASMGFAIVPLLGFLSVRAAAAALGLQVLQATFFLARPADGERPEEALPDPGSGHYQDYIYAKNLSDTALPAVALHRASRLQGKERDQIAAALLRMTSDSFAQVRGQLADALMDQGVFRRTDVWFAVQDGRVLGWVQVNFADDELTYIEVEPSLRERFIGSELVATAFRALLAEESRHTLFIRGVSADLAGLLVDLGLAAPDTAGGTIAMTRTEALRAVAAQETRLRRYAAERHLRFERQAPAGLGSPAERQLPSSLEISLLPLESHPLEIAYQTKLKELTEVALQFLMGKPETARLLELAEEMEDLLRLAAKVARDKHPPYTTKFAALVASAENPSLSALEGQQLGSLIGWLIPRFYYLMPPLQPPANDILVSELTAGAQIATPRRVIRHLLATRLIGTLRLLDLEATTIGQAADATRWDPIAAGSQPRYFLLRDRLGRLSFRLALHELIHIFYSASGRAKRVWQSTSVEEWLAAAHEVVIAMFLKPPVWTDTGSHEDLLSSFDLGRAAAKIYGPVARAAFVERHLKPDDVNDPRDDFRVYREGYVLAGVAMATSWARHPSDSTAAFNDALFHLDLVAQDPEPMTLARALAIVSGERLPPDARPPWHHSWRNALWSWWVETWMPLFEKQWREALRSESRRSERLRLFLAPGLTVQRRTASAA